MKSADIQYWDHFWAGDDLGPQWKHLAAADLADAEPVLDIGCGSGLFLEMLKGRGMRRLVGCDISATSARKTLGRGFAALRCDAATDLPFVDGSFATVSLIDVLEHTFEPSRVLREASRVGREVILVVPNFNSLVARIQVQLGRVPENNTPRKRHTYWFNYDVLMNLLASLDMEILTVRFHAFKYRHALLSRPFNLLTTIRPQLFALAFAVKARTRAR